MPTTVLSPNEVSNRLKTIPEWKLQDGKIVREWQFKDFVAAMHFVNAVAAAAEAANHHPDIDIRYNRVFLALVSHDAGGITEADLAMAGKLNTIK